MQIKTNDEPLRRSLIMALSNEEKWFKRLERCLKDMPGGVEIAVTDGSVTMLPDGAVGRAFDTRGDLDRFDEEYLDSLQHPRIWTCGECL